MKRVSFLKCFDISNEIQKGVDIFCKESGHIAPSLKNSPVQENLPTKKSSKWAAKIIAAFVAVFKI